MGKQVVIFSSVGTVVKGVPSLVFPLNHPSHRVSNTTHAMTSPVISLYRDPEFGVLAFETENTVYIHSTENDIYDGDFIDACIAAEASYAHLIEENKV